MVDYRAVNDINVQRPFQLLIAWQLIHVSSKPGTFFYVVHVYLPKPPLCNTPTST